jgi:hypothetical protein
MLTCEQVLLAGALLLPLHPVLHHPAEPAPGHLAVLLPLLVPQAPLLLAELLPRLLLQPAQRCHLLHPVGLPLLLAQVLRLACVP